MAFADLAFPGGVIGAMKPVEQALRNFNAWFARANDARPGKGPVIKLPSDWMINAWIRGCLPNEYCRLALLLEGMDPAQIGMQDLRFTTRAMDMVKLRDPHPLDGNNGLTGVLLSNTSMPGMPDLFTLWNRELIDEGVVDFVLRHGGIADPNIASCLKNLRYEIPPIQDLIRFSVRESFDIATIKKYGYADDIPNEVRKYAAMQGLAGGTGQMKPVSRAADGGIDPARESTWTDYYWYAHWELPSNTQSYLMLQRLYPQSRYGPSPTIKGDVAFTSQDLKDVLKANDYPAYWRERLEAISYLPLTRVDVRRMYDVGVMDKAGIYHAYRNIGYDDTNANHLTEFTAKLKKDKETKKPRMKAVNKVCAAYSTGFVTRGEFARYLFDIGVPNNEGEMIVQECDYDKKLKRVNKMVATIGKQYVKGVVNKNDTIKQLTALGILPARIEEYLEEWGLELSPGVREANAGDILKWFKSGMLTARDAFDRLVHLGYENRDATLMIGYANNEISIQRAKSLRAESKELAAKVKRESREAKAAMRTDVQTAKTKLRESINGASEKNLKKWLEEGDMTPQQVKAFLTLKGWTNQIADTWIKNTLRGIATKGMKDKTQGEADETPEV